MIHKNKNQTLSNKFLYLSFNSNQGNVVRVMPKFKDQDRLNLASNLVLENKEQAAIVQDSGLDSRVTETMINTIQEMKANNEAYMPDFGHDTKLNSIANDPLHFQAFRMIIDKIREKIRKSKMRGQNDDFIKRNKILTKYWKDYEFERRKRHQDSLQTNLETALKKKELILRFKREKYELVNQMKVKVKEEALKHKKMVNKIVAWRIIMKQHQAVYKCNQMYSNKKEETIRSKAELSSYYRISRKYKQVAKKSGATLDTRKIRIIMK